MLPSIPDTSKVVPPHPFETFCPSTHYSNFEADFISLAIHATCSQVSDPGFPAFSVTHTSLEETPQFLLDTDYDHSGHKLCLHIPLPTLKLFATIPLTYTTSVVGYINNKHPDYYMWQSGYFEKGPHVVLGTIFRKVKIVGSYGVDRNYIIMRFEEVGGS